MFWASWSGLSRGRPVLFLDWVTPATQAAKRVTCVSPGEECGPEGLTKWRKRGDHDVGQFSMTGPTDVAIKPSHFYCRICRKDVSVLTHGQHEIWRHFQGSRHFPRINVGGWRRQAGKCWIMRGLSWLLRKWSDSGREYWGLF